MSSDDDSSRTTLSLTKKPRAANAAERGGAPSKRSGARARAVAIAARQALDRDDAPIERRAPVRNREVDRPGSERRIGESTTPGRGPAGIARGAGRQPGKPRPTTDRARYTGISTSDSASGNSGGNPAYTTRAPSRQPERATVIVTSENDRYSIFAPCPQGLEQALVAEMQALGFKNATAGRAGCRFTADWEGVQRANLYSRLATRILVQVAQAPMSADDDIYTLAMATPWERWFGAEHTLRVDTSAIKSPVLSLHYCNLRVKDGICDRLRDVEGERPSIDTVRPDARVHAFLSQDTATLYLDTSGESLFKRGWRLDKGEAPLRENLAAGMLALAGWDPSQPLLDPFCGSGTLLIEAAWIALGIPPGIARPLGFERLRGHDGDAWDAVKEEAYSRIAPGLDAPIVGYDIDRQAIEFARRNAERAWLAPDAIDFQVRDAREAPRLADTGWIVTNPPYGDRLDAGAPELWSGWATRLKQSFGGWQLHAISSDLGLPQKLRLKPIRRTPLYNGALDCRLFGFELVKAGYRDGAPNRAAASTADDTLRHIETGDRP